MSSRFTMSAALAATMLLAGPLAAQQRITLPAKDRPVRLELRTLFQVGALDGEEWETFAGITDLAFGPDGSLYILDGMARRVFAYDASGRYRRTIGGPGEGPGEFGMPTSLAVLPSGELVVNDAGKASFQFFAADGSFVRSMAPGEDLGRAVGRLRAASDGLFTETMQMSRRPNPGSGDLQRVQLPPRSVTRLSLGAQQLEGRRLFNAPPRESRFSSVNAGNGSMQMRMSVSAFEPSLLWTPLADGRLAAMHTAEYRISLLDGSGKPRYLERAIEPLKVTAADRKRYLERRQSGAGNAAVNGAVVAFRSSGGSAGAPSGPPPTMRLNSADLKESDISWGDVIPVVSGLGADSFGRLWIQRSARVQGDGPIDLVGPDYRYLGTLSPQPMPRAFGPDGRLAFVIRDDLDVQRVVVRQLAH